MSISSEELKQKGNDAFTAGNFQEAVEHFTSALLLDPSNAVLYSNRSAAEASLNLWESALQDAEKAIELRPTWFKGYSRRGAAFLGLGQAERAVEAFKRGLEIEPNNASLIQGLEAAERKANYSNNLPPSAFDNPFADPQLMQRLGQNPRTAPFLSEPDFLVKLEELRRDPQALSRHLSDQRVLAALSAMLNVDVQTTPQRPEEPKREEVKKEVPGNEEPKLTPEQEKALAEKELGNEAYKQKDFESALEHYEAAFQLDPNNTSFLANRSAVLFEQGKYEECIRICEEAVSHGREHHAEFKLIGRMLGRIGSCWERLGDLDAAIRYYNKSLTEARNAEIADKLKAAEKAKREAEKAALYDPQVAEAERSAGNAAFAKQDYVQAVKHYTEAIRRDETDSRAYSNRAACYLKLAAIPEGLKDAEKCIELDPSFVKGYLRKASLLAAKREWSSAIQTCEAGLEHDKDGKHRGEFQGLISRCYAQQTGQASAGNEEGLSDEERAKRAMQNPEVQQILSDPAMRLILSQMQTDPAALREHMKNPEVAAKIGKLIQCGVLRTA